MTMDCTCTVTHALLHRTLALRLIWECQLQLVFTDEDSVAFMLSPCHTDAKPHVVFFLTCENTISYLNMVVTAYLGLLQ